DWNLIALGVHALHVPDVVAALHREAGAIRIARPNSRPPEETSSRADGRAESRTTGRGSDGRPKPGTDHPTHPCARPGIARTSLVGRGPSLLQRPLPAHPVIGLELLEILATARQHHHARPRRHCGAPCRKEERANQDDSPPCGHRALSEHTVSLVIPESRPM